jgi:rhodanese-related sulfurtransferase
VAHPNLERALTPLTLDSVLRQMNAGAQVVDVREPADFAGAPLHGSINISLRGSFATWAGTL